MNILVTGGSGFIASHLVDRLIAEGNFVINLDKLDFIKLDIEGYEPLAISGGIQTIKKYKPVIALEFWADHSSNVDINFTKNNFKELIDIGYDVIHILGPDFLFIPN